MSALYLDTHAVVFLYSGLTEKFSQNTLDKIEKNRLLISPIVELEIQYLFEIKRLRCSPQEFILGLSSLIGLEVSREPFEKVVFQSLSETWTRDVFDRIITAQARLENLPLVTRDRLIQANYQNAIWA